MNYFSPSLQSFNRWRKISRVIRIHLKNKNNNIIDVNGSNECHRAVVTKTYPVDVQLSSFLTAEYIMYFLNMYIIILKVNDIST